MLATAPTGRIWMPGKLEQREGSVNGKGWWRGLGMPPKPLFEMIRIRSWYGTFREVVDDPVHLGDDLRRATGRLQVLRNLLR